MRKAQARYKYDYDRVRRTPALHSGMYVFQYEPSLSNVLNSQAETLARQPKNKLQSRTTGPFRNVSIQNNTVTLDKGSIQNTVSISRVTHAPLATGQTQRTETFAQLELDLTKESTPSEARDI